MDRELLRCWSSLDTVILFRQTAVGRGRLDELD